MTKKIGFGVALMSLAALAILAIFPYTASERTDAPPLRGAMEAFQVADNPAPAPDATFYNADQEPVTLDDFEGEVVLLNFWATWCAPCVREMPTLLRLQEKLEDQGLAVVALSSDRAGAAAVEPFYREHGLSELGIYLDPASEATRAFGVRALPTTLLIDRQGREVGRLEGDAEWDSPEAEALIRHYLEGKG